MDAACVYAECAGLAGVSARCACLQTILVFRAYARKICMRRGVSVCDVGVQPACVMCAYETVTKRRTPTVECLNVE